MDCCNTGHKHSKPIEKKIEVKELDKNHKKEKYLNYFSSFSGFSGIFSSYQVCHSICLGTIALLSLIGITLTGLPFLFLQKFALPLWTIALALFAVSIFIYIKHKHHKIKNLLIFNFGAIVVGIPFENLAFLRIYFLAFGFSIIIFSLYLIVKKRLEVKYEPIQ
ncbi:MAG: hypothetical protein AABX61_00630 [Nanoarchaeota archaeon]